MFQAKNKLVQNEHTHFHPSGDSSPSEEDKAVTKRLDAASEIIDIPLLDHIIIGKYGSFSMKRQKESTG
ncbi:JAB domain-containing protein [Pectinatus frisingensis]|uniref:JAB domain-containing protein n=1 Tax=Pectinatus frisingensis TaxID=865 RepID=UPI0018C5637F|nr:JAB domain-containing protein [Pectinatus frisingensis]